MKILATYVPRSTSGLSSYTAPKHTLAPRPCIPLGPPLRDYFIVPHSQYNLWRTRVLWRWVCIVPEARSDKDGNPRWRAVFAGKLPEPRRTALKDWRYNAVAR